jgi:hypothetical protein
MRFWILGLGIGACSSSSGGGALPADAGAPDAAPVSCVDRLVPTIVEGASANEVTVANDPPSAGGIFDPSIVYPAGAPAGAMAYSAFKAKDDITTRIAISNDEGATWTYAATANATVALPGGAGNLIHEVSSLVFDASDPDAARKWKLFSFRYAARGEELLYVVGHIALQTAPAPEGPWSQPAPNVGWRGPNVFSSEGARFVAQDEPALADCNAFSEPSALATTNGLVLAVGCVSSDLAIRVVLLRSTDHAASWSYVGVLARSDDARCLGRASGLARVNAAELFEAGGKTWAFLTPESLSTGYQGCAAVEVDLGGGGVKRDASGAPVVTRLLGTADERFSGACAYAEGARRATALMSIAFLSEARKFRIFRSGVTVP